MDGVSKRFSNKVTRFSFLMAIFVIYIHANNLAYYGISPDQLCIPTIVVEIGGGTWRNSSTILFYDVSVLAF